MTSKIEELKAKKTAAWLEWQRVCDHKDHVRNNLEKATWAKQNQPNIDTLYSQFDLEFDLAMESEQQAHAKWVRLTYDLEKLEGN